jgi:F0F1-type ATP synthase delta subunit
MENKPGKIKLKKLELVLAFEPDGKLVEKISRKVEEALGRGITMNIKVDKSILGGAVIFFDGRYYNGSLRKKLEEFFEEK